ncbi:hypothetical protein F5879DRAFT_337854 [Lentinula edodes]|nr:hypothetical protein F5879DRAFT_337854 [Lentinula edodes]
MLYRYLRWLWSEQLLSISVFIVVSFRVVAFSIIFRIIILGIVKLFALGNIHNKEGNQQYVQGSSVLSSKPIFFSNFSYASLSAYLDAAHTYRDHWLHAEC